MDKEQDFKVGDLVMYANKIKDAESIDDLFMKTAKVISIKDNLSFPIEIQLLNENKKNFFKRKELIYATLTEEQLGRMLVRNEITDETYKRLIKKLEEQHG